MKNNGLDNNQDAVDEVGGAITVPGSLEICLTLNPVPESMQAVKAALRSLLVKEVKPPELKISFWELVLISVPFLCFWPFLFLYLWMDNG